MCTDNDEDGFSITGGECGLVDCNDENAGIHPGAAELCDWIDNNCDGTTDNNENCVVACSANTDCGTNNWINELFCQSNDIYQNFKSFICNLAGTYDSYCSDSTIAQLKTDCGEDSCGSFGENYCKSGDVYHSRTCNDKGCTNGGCFDNQSTDEQKVQDCSYGCLTGTCLFEPPVITCNNNADCDDENSHTEDVCINPGEENSYCSNENIVCLQNSECDDLNNHTEDSCVNPGQENSYCTHETHEDILCLINSECGTNGYINQPSCSNGNVVQDYQTFTCNNPGTTSSSCSSNSSPQVKQTCQYGCSNGACLPQPVQCTTNADCNSLDNYSDDYCSSGDVYYDFNDYSCQQGSCIKNTTKNLVEECDSDETCSAGECDKEEDDDNNRKKQVFAGDLLSDELLPLTPLVKGKIINQGAISLVPEEKQVKGSNLWLILIAILVVLMIFFFILIVFYSRRR